MKDTVIHNLISVTDLRRGARDIPPSSKIISISCSFWDIYAITVLFKLISLKINSNSNTEPVRG